MYVTFVTHFVIRLFVSMNVYKMIKFSIVDGVRKYTGFVRFIK